MNLRFFNPIGDFKYSVNIEYDLNNDNKIKSYIPTSGAISIIKDILYSVIGNEGKATRSRLLTGAYGKGKSHMTLTLLALLSGRDKKLFRTLLTKCKQTDLELYNNIKKYIDSGMKLLPVVINTASDSLKTNFLNSLKIALDNNNLSDLMPKTFFDSAIKVIDNWQVAFKDTYHLMEQSMGLDGKLIKSKLKKYDQDTYNSFKAIYPSLTSGSEFNPMQGTDTAKLYSNVAKSIKQYGYNGIFIVYDEFGKFLEGSADIKSTAYDLKLLQDMAELCERTKKDEQINLLLISHKGIDNYVSNLSKERIDNWKAIAGRFYKMSMQNKDEEIYEIVSTVLHKDIESYKVFRDQHVEKFNSLYSSVQLDSKNQASKTGAFDGIIKNRGMNFIDECYPLNPYSLLMLPKVSELVAQNERSIFTYLTANEKNSVSYFIKKSDSDFPIIEPDAIYDYFEPLFKGEPFGSPIREQWEITAAAVAKLNSCDNDLAIKLVKTIALIYIINEFNILPPSIDLLTEIYCMNKPREIQNALRVLREEELLIELEFKPYVRIRKSSNNNIKELIDIEISTIKKLDKKNILLESMNTRYFYPVEYNDKNEITRYFTFQFITYDEYVELTKNAIAYGDYNSTGTIFAILINSEEERISVLEKAKEIKSPQVVFVVPNAILDIEHYLYKYQAISNLISKKANDALLIDELEYIKMDLYDFINDYVNKYYLKPELGKSTYIHKGKIIKIARRKEFSKLLSDICDELFVYTPKIINENINRSRISSTMKNVQKKILEAILSQTLTKDLGLIGSQNINVIRSVYVVPGIIKDLNEPQIDCVNCDPNIKHVLKTIVEFFESASTTSKYFSELYCKLMSPKNQIGLKSGVIPFYIAIALRNYKERAIIYYKNREQKLTADVLMAINSNPSEFLIRIECLDGAERTYLTLLSSQFCTYNRELDIVTSTFDNIVSGMQRWYFQLPKFDRESKNYADSNREIKALDEAFVKLKNKLGNPEINPREFLFETIPNIFHMNDFYKIGGEISRFKLLIDSNLQNNIDYVVQVLKTAINAADNSSLYSASQDFLETLNENTKNHIFDGDANILLDVLKNANNDDRRTAKLVLKRMFSLRIEDFSDSLMSEVEPSIRDAVDTINEYNNKLQSGTTSTSSYTVKFNSDNENRELHFDELGEMNYQEKMFYNTILSTIDEFNEALSSSEKGQVMLKILEELYK